MAVPNGLVACVVDEDPRFHLEALRWFASLTGAAGVAPGDLVVHAVGAAESDALDILRSSGVRVHSVDRFDQRSPHCNKISGALGLSDFGSEGTVVMTDTDVVALEDPRQLRPGPGVVAAKPVYWPNPPVEVMQRIFQAAGMSLPRLITLDWNDESTVEGNANGGVYVVDHSILEDLPQAWARWARWLLNRSHLLEQWTYYVDQVAMALAIRDLGLRYERLEPRWNFPAHLTSVPSDAAAPAVIHYHRHVDPQAMILDCGLPPVDEQISRANQLFARLLVELYPAATERERALGVRRST